MTVNHEGHHIHPFRFDGVIFLRPTRWFDSYSVTGCDDLEFNFQCFPLVSRIVCNLTGNLNATGYILLIIGELFALTISARLCQQIAVGLFNPM